MASGALLSSHKDDVSLAKMALGIGNLRDPDTQTTSTRTIKISSHLPEGKVSLVLSRHRFNLPVIYTVVHTLLNIVDTTIEIAVSDCFLWNLRASKGCFGAGAEVRHIERVLLMNQAGWAGRGHQRDWSS